MHSGGLDMALNKYKIGQLIEIVDERNSFGITDFYGININKEFMPTVANTEGLDETNYKVVRKNRFVFSGMQTGRDECIRISMYLHDKPIIVSPAYTTFEVVATDVIIPTYFFMLFLSKERDRLGWFYSDGSIRSNLDWDRFCDIELNLPDISTQQKYVDIYKAMVANQQSYERGLADLKLVCDGYIEDLRRKMPCEKIGPYIEKVDERNSNLSLGVADVKSVNMDGTFAETVANVDADRIHTYKVVKPNEFAYTNRINIGSIARRLPEDGNCLVSASYDVFEITNKESLLPEYLTLWIRRSEFFRSTGFYAVGSVKDNFSVDMMKLLKIPIPDIFIQQAIVNLYQVYLTRKEINEQLKNQIKDICPILIKGSLEE